MITIELSVEDNRWGNEEELRALAEKVNHVTFNFLGYAKLTSELSLLFTDNAHIQKINAEWRGKDKPTNVLSFPAFDIKVGEKPGPLLGDIVFGFETVKTEAEEEAKLFHHHLAHLMVHGLLHLLGYDHETEKQAEEMEGLERKILHVLAISDPYAISCNDHLEIGHD